MSDHIFNELFPAIRLKHQGNVLHCYAKRTATKNFDLMREAYTLLTGFDYFKDSESTERFAEEGGVVESYRSS